MKLLFWRLIYATNGQHTPVIHEWVRRPNWRSLFTNILYFLWFDLINICVMRLAVVNTATSRRRKLIISLSILCFNIMTINLISKIFIIVLLPFRKLQRIHFMQICFQNLEKLIIFHEDGFAHAILYIRRVPPLNRLQKPIDRTLIIRDILILRLMLLRWRVVLLRWRIMFLRWTFIHNVNCFLYLYNYVNTHSLSNITPK